jgi:outer membrane protein
MFVNRFIKVGLACLLLYIFSCAATFAAAETDALKIGIMNVQKVLVQSAAGQKAKEKFETKGKELEAQFAGEQAAIVELQKEIEKKGSVWSKDKKDDMVLEFNKKRRDLQTKSEDARQEMKKLQDKELEPILKALETIVDDFGKNNGYSVILDSKNGVIYFDDALDVSDALITELNKVLK